MRSTASTRDGAGCQSLLASAALSPFSVFMREGDSMQKTLPAPNATAWKWNPAGACRVHKRRPLPRSSTTRAALSQR